MSENENKIEKNIPLIVFQATVVAGFVKKISDIIEPKPQTRKFAIAVECVSYGAALVAAQFTIKMLKKTPSAEKNSFSTRAPEKQTHQL